MRIRFDRAGGGAPALQMRRSLTIDTATLTPTEAADVERALGAADVAAAAGRPAPPAQARSGEFHYRLVVEDAGRERIIDVHDSDMPPSLRPLVEWLIKRAERGGT